MVTDLTHQALKARQRKERDTHSPSVTLRVHRALSWLGRAEQEADDPDARFTFLWIAFNAAYATESYEESPTESQAFRSFLEKLLELDRKGRIAYVVWEEFTGSIRELLRNPYVFADFWRHLNGQMSQDEWRRRFDGSRSAASRAIGQHDTVSVLGIVFARLYVLRNQLIHGGATWNGRVNRDQVRDCTKLMSKLVPVIIEIMLDYPDYDWGPATYPVIAEGAGGV